jgi:hypothetical protein
MIIIATMILITFLYPPIFLYEEFNEKDKFKFQTCLKFEARSLRAECKLIHISRPIYIDRESWAAVLCVARMTRATDCFSIYKVQMVNPTTQNDFHMKI